MEGEGKRRAKKKKRLRLGHDYSKRPYSIGSKVGKYPLTCVNAVAKEMGEL